MNRVVERAGVLQPVVNAERLHRVGLCAFACALALLGLCAAAQARAALRIVRYHGYTVAVPRSWPVLNLSEDPSVCVRFDRHAVYLGVPGSRQRCPAHAAGHTEAILIAPLAAAAAGGGAGGAGLAHELPLSGAGTSFVARRHGVVVAATWSADKRLVNRALHRGSLPAPPSASIARARGGGSIRARGGGSIRARAAAAVYAGPGFDACSAPSPQAMAAWGASPYRAVGVYVGGVNAACAQPNLSPAWVSAEVAAGWHLIPTYVSLQAPGNGCGCASIAPSQASVQGAAAASNAISDVQSLGIPPGNPIYDDMEAYTHTAANTNAVLQFLSAWTSTLHAAGYVSGVYSSGGSGIADLVAADGTGFVEPDDIWIAEWNGEQTTASAYVPSSEWAGAQRIHQYSGAHNESYGGSTLNIDGDFLDGATADTASGFAPAPEPPPPPLPTTPPALAIAPAAATGNITLSPTWPGAVGLSSWHVLADNNSSMAAMSAVAGAPFQGTGTQITLLSAAPYFEVEAIGTAGQVLGTSPVAATPAHVAIYGRSAFVPSASGVGGLPVGCYTGSVCRISTTITAGHTTIAGTGPELIGAGGGGIVYFTLSPRGRKWLTRARGGGLPVTVRIRDASGAASTAAMRLIGFATSGRGPARRAAGSPTARLTGLTDFVSARGVGGILVDCVQPQICNESVTLKVGRTIIARTGPEVIGADELGYVIFSLSGAGRRLLARSPGNQLGAQVAVADGESTAAGAIALVRF